MRTEVQVKQGAPNEGVPFVSVEIEPRRQYNSQSAGEAPKLYAGAYLSVERSRSNFLVWNLVSALIEGTEDKKVWNNAKTKIAKRLLTDIVKELGRIYPCAEPGCSHIFVNENNRCIVVKLSSVHVIDVNMPTAKILRLARQYESVVPASFSMTDRQLRRLGFACNHDFDLGSNAIVDRREHYKAQQTRQRYYQKRQQASGVLPNGLLAEVYVTLFHLLHTYPGMVAACGHFYRAQTDYKKHCLAKAIPAVSRIVCTLYGKPVYRTKSKFRRNVLLAYRFIPGIFGLVRRCKEAMAKKVFIKDCEYVVELYQLVPWIRNEYRVLKAKEKKTAEYRAIEQKIREGLRQAREDFIQCKKDRDAYYALQWR